MNKSRIPFRVATCLLLFLVTAFLVHPAQVLASNGRPLSLTSSTTPPSGKHIYLPVVSGATSNSISPTPGPTSGKDPIIFFNGDLVSGSSLARAQSVVALIKNLMAQHPGTRMLVASTGDNEQESTPTLSDYQNYFGATYQSFVDQHIFMQVRGNHDTQDAGHGAAYAQYFGANSHLVNGLTNYSYDLGAWHFVGLDQVNSSVNQTSLSFLKSDLAAHPNLCTLVYWHVPTYSSGSVHGDSTGLKTLNQAEYDAGVDVQINGHDHDYQRFFPLNPSGGRDDGKGIT
ncbi:MAG: metallophosphoesterase, partial [Anaerolineaceae bacterium]|nr:metallophosphoesterase [Anaerolineaceae bacterium]